MKAYRIYYMDGCRKVYLCESGGYWMHHCESPEQCCIYLTPESAQMTATANEGFVSPSEAKRHIEEYEETRGIAVNRHNGNARDAALLRYLSDRYSYDIIQEPAKA